MISVRRASTSLMRGNLTKALLTAITSLASLALVGTLAPTFAHATSYLLTEADSSAGLGAAPYGTVDVTTDGSDLKFVISLDPNWFVHTGNDNKKTIAFSLADDGTKIISGSSGSTSALPSPFTQVGPEPTTALPADNNPFPGLFNYAINCPGNGGNSCNQSTALTFWVLGAGALSLLSTPGLTGLAPVFITVDISNPDGKTGVVGGTLSAVPLPPALPLFVGGLGAMGWFARRKKRKATEA